MFKPENPCYIIQIEIKTTILKYKNIHDTMLTECSAELLLPTPVGLHLLSNVSLQYKTNPYAVTIIELATLYYH